MIDLEGVSHRYATAAKPALEELRLHVESGEIVGVLGLNGSGKTTLLRLVSGLMRPSGGTVRVDGSDQRQAIRRAVALAPDQGAVYPFLTVAEAGAFFEKALPAWDRVRWAELVDLLQLPPEQTPQAMSKGQRARLRLAQALAQRSPVLLLDEPLAGIDLRSRDRIVESLAEDLARRPRTVLVATHEIMEIESLFDRVVLLEQGRVAVDVAADELRASTDGSIESYVRKGAW